MAESRLQLIIDAVDRTKAGLSSVSNGLSKVQGKIEANKESFQKMAAVGTGAFLAIGAVIGKGIGDYVEAERSQRQLEHAIIAVSKGTKEQVEQVNELTAAMQKKSGIDADALNMGVAQLSTFGLQSKTVIALTKSLADLTVNQNGVGASADQYVQSANVMAKALQGQFGVLEKSGIRFTEAQQKLILYGNETQKAAALTEGLNQNLRETTDTLAGTAEGQMAVFQQSLGEVSETIGKMFLPMLTEILNKIQPILEKVMEWTSAHPELTRNIILATAGLAALTAGIGFLGLAIPPIIAGFTTLVTLMTGPLGIVIAFSAVVAIIYKAVDAWNALRMEQDALNKTAQAGIEMQTKLAAAIDVATDPRRKAKLETLAKDLEAANREAQRLANLGFLGSVKEGFVDTVGKVFNVKDAVITPRGDVVKTDPADYLIATKNPGSLMGGGLTLNFAGAVFMGKEGIAREIGDEIVKQLQLRQRLAN